MPTTDRKLRVFLCHASQDKPAVRELYQRLLAEGWIDPWLDEEKLLPGQDWNMEIEKAVETTDAVIVCLSKNSVTKEGYVQRELRFALNLADEKPEGTIFVIPFRLDDCIIPHRIRMWHRVDYSPSLGLDASFLKIKASLRQRYLVVTKMNKGDKFLDDGTKLEWIDKKETRVGKAKISETNYVLRRKKKKK